MRSDCVQMTHCIITQTINGRRIVWRTGDNGDNGGYQWKNIRTMRVEENAIYNAGKIKFVRTEQNTLTRSRFGSVLC
jgi:hypothetical protein